MNHWSYLLLQECLIRAELSRSENHLPGGDSKTVNTHFALLPSWTKLYVNHR